MSFRKFKPDDLILNTMKTYPTCEFFIFDSRVWYNNKPDHVGKVSSMVPTGIESHRGKGNISLYEQNVDRVAGATGRYMPPIESPYFDADNPIPDKKIIYPFITKDGAGSSFKTVGPTTYANEFAYGDVLTSSYPLTASITRNLMYAAGALADDGTIPEDDDHEDQQFTKPNYRQWYSLRNRLNFYGLRSQHYLVSSSHGNKDEQDINLISIPSIFWGSTIKRGSLSLKWYLTGTLIAEAQDVRQNGELIQTGPSGSTGSGSVAGVVLYDEGFLVLTGAWDLNDAITVGLGTASAHKPSWKFFGAGANDGVNQAGAGSSYNKASFNLSFKGTTETQVMTMFAHARRGQANYSNNPTFLRHGQRFLETTSSYIYEENPTRTILNTVSSSYSDYTASFKRQVYISRIALYDGNKNLIGIASLSNPVLKEEDRDLTFKIRLDI
tara:strand:+ start:4126 stop:5445 length:1320 start_codon:yes stop_codon:yes gene_type:complete